MFSEFNLIHLNAEKRKLDMERGAKERLLKQINAEKPGFKCLICEKLAGLFMVSAKKLEALAAVKPQADFPAIKSEDLRKLLDDPTAQGLIN